MKIAFLGQGYQTERDKPIGRYLSKYLASNFFHSFTAISAFASVGGILGLKKHIEAAKSNFGQINIIVGIDQKGTSKEALETIVGLDVKAFVFTQREHPIFHPKVYLFEGQKRAVLMVGSSNLTLKGLWQNVEASILLEIESKEEKGIIEEMKGYFSSLFDFSDPNLIPLTTAVIEQLVQINKVPDEAERSKLHDEKKKILSSPEKAQSVRDIIENLMPARAVNRLPVEFFDAVKSARKLPVAKEIPKESGPEEMPSEKGILVWRRKDLPASSVQMADTGTNPTGGLRLVQAHFEVNGRVINQTTYFRDLFSQYTWESVSKNPFKEKAKVGFHVTVLCEYLGEFELEVRHKPSGEAGQGNYTTSISWGALGETIRNADLSGHELRLYAPANDNDSFHIEII